MMEAHCCVTGLRQTLNLFVVAFDTRRRVIKTHKEDSDAVLLVCVRSIAAHAG